MKTIVWFRQDLRISDNPALYNAAQVGDVIPIYIMDNTHDPWSIGSAAKCWLHYSLKSLQDSLNAIGSGLIIKQGNPKDILQQLIHETGANSVYWNACYEPHAIIRDSDIKITLNNNGVDVQSYNGSLLFDPGSIKNQQGHYYKVYTPFAKECISNGNVSAPLPTPEIKGFKTENDCIDSLNLLPHTPNWSNGIVNSWNFGENAAHNMLLHFVQEKSDYYSNDRDFPNKEGTSRLSPYLHFGEISPRQVWHLIYNQNNKFISQLLWREFSYHLLYKYPQLPTEPYRQQFNNFPWQQEVKMLEAWKTGMTGYPIVDAGMRELLNTGYMHNRVRMIAASFLTKHLLIHWHEGAKYFWDTLVDADLANNSASWQWVAGCGFDAAPYFRIFNPTLQSIKFDLEGQYIKKWVPELRSLSSKMIHEPWKYINNEYPAPIVDHNFARARALAAYKMIA